MLCFATLLILLRLTIIVYLKQVAGKADIKSLSSQLEAVRNAKAGNEPTTTEFTSPAVTAPANNAPLPKPHVWAGKSWATVLASDPPAVAEPTPAAEDEDDEEGSESESESEDEHEAEQEDDSEPATQSSAVDANAGVDHFTAAATASLENLALEDSLEHADASASYVTGFHDDCGCAHTEEGHTHEHAAAEPVAKAPVPVAAAAESSTKEPWHSRMMRPSGLSSGNNPIAHAAESNKMRLEDDGKGWINTENLLQHRGRNGYSSTSNGAAKKPKPAKVAGDDASEAVTESSSTAAPAKSAAKKNKKKKRPTKVACLTTDFSMQNVMLQMSLKVMSVDGLMIKSAKQWVLRCMGCFEVHYDMDRLFCRKCGGHHLSRVSASVDSGGELRLHLKKNYHVDLRGSQYSLPAPGKQGRYQGELLLREDQLLAGIWKQKVVKIRKDIKSAFGEDVTSDVGMHINKGQAIKIGMGKQNVNSAKGRERRGKSKSHTVK